MLSPQSAGAVCSPCFFVAWVPQGDTQELRVEVHVCVVDDLWILRTVRPDHYEELEAVTDDVALCERLNALHVTLRNHKWNSVARCAQTDLPEEPAQQGQCSCAALAQWWTRGVDDSSAFPWDVQIGSLT